LRFELRDRLFQCCFIRNRVEFRRIQRHGDVIGFDHCRELHVHGFHDAHRRDAVFCVVGQLLCPAAIRFVERLLHRSRHAIGV